MSERGRRVAATARRIGAMAVASLLCPLGPALAHTSERGYVMLLPTGHYLAGGAVAVAASFLALAVLPRALPAQLAAQRLALAVSVRRGRAIVSLLGVVVFAALLYCGWNGSRDPLSNPLPLVFWTLVWSGLTVVQGTLGDLWAWINPWYGPWRALDRLRGPDRPPPLRLPEAVGYWPALLLFAGFAWFELIDPAPDDPSRLATLAAIYFVVNLAAMLLFGHAQWSRRGECLSAFFTLIAGFSVVGRAADGRLALRWPGAGLADRHAMPPSGVLFVFLTLASVSFDGLSRTFFWLGLNGVNPLEFPGRTALIGINTAGLALTFVALAGAFLAAVFLGGLLARGGAGFTDAAGTLVWSIVPIALAYHFAHYLTVFLVNGQYALVALSDPLARGWNLFGTANLQVSPGLTLGAGAAWVIWNLQAAAIVLGHVLAVAAAHLMALRLHADDRDATLSQLPLTILMVLYTVFGLWLLSTPTGA